MVGGTETDVNEKTDENAVLCLLFGNQQNTVHITELGILWHIEHKKQIQVVV